MAGHGTPRAGFLFFRKQIKICPEAGEPCRAGEPCSAAARPRGRRTPSFITLLTHSCCLPGARRPCAHTAGRCTPTQCHAVKLTISLGPNTGSILSVSRKVKRRPGKPVSAVLGEIDGLTIMTLGGAIARRCGKLQMSRGTDGWTRKSNNSETGGFQQWRRGKLETHWKLTGSTRHETAMEAAFLLMWKGANYGLGTICGP